MARWFVSRIVGTGTDTDPFRAKVQRLPGVTACVAQIPSDPLTGGPLRQWALCHVEATDYAAVAADPDVFALPNIAKDQLLGSLTLAQRTAIRNRMQSAFGLDPDVSVNRPFRALLREIGQRDEAHFHEDNFGVS